MSTNLKDLEISWEGEPVGILKTEVVAFGVVDIPWGPYRSIAHLRMFEEFKKGVPVIFEIKLNEEKIILKLIEHHATHIKIERT